MTHVIGLIVLAGIMAICFLFGRASAGKSADEDQFGWETEVAVMQAGSTVILWNEQLWASPQIADMKAAFQRAGLKVEVVEGMRKPDGMYPVIKEAK